MATSWRLFWLSLATAAAALAQAPAKGIDFERARRHWSLKPVVKPAVPPASSASWAKTPVDNFVSARIARAAQSPAAPLAKAAWLRRVTFDVTGLPPTPADLDAFLKDTSPGAATTVVERLLASPHYGERWARHWLDLVRFAETNGHEFDNNKLDAWRYRDYVIRAFNQDVPYDQFVREHLAGDILPNPRQSADGTHLESPIATGFLWFGEVLNSATDSVKTRADTVDNQIDVLGKTFLGLTLACARCHDHKFDPVPTRDYYALAGVFHSTYLRETVVDSPARADAIRTAAKPAAFPTREAKLALREGDTLFEEFASFDGWQNAGLAFAKAPVNGIAASIHAAEGSLTSKMFRMPKLWVHVRLAGTKADTRRKEDADIRVTVVADDHKSAHLAPTGKPGFEWRSARMTKEIGRLCYFEIVDRDPNGFLAVDKIVFSDSEKPPVDDAADTGPLPVSAAPMPSSAWAMISQEMDPHNTRVHIRGDHKNLGEEVPRGFLTVLADGAPPAAQGSGRLELAQRIASPANPLTARVMVNRIWKHHFGEGLVRTPDNFGLTGERPSDPELLDYLAASFVESGWSVKAMHRLILLSSAYAQTRQPRRLEAEAIRDSILAVAGTLDRTLFGPSVMPHISKYQDGRGKPSSGPLDGNRRRSIYIQVRRNFLTPMFLAFDYPLPISTIGQRGSSTVPSQALLMMNNEFIADQASRWAARAAPDLDLMFREAYARRPEPWERTESLAFAEKRGWPALAHVLLNSAEFLYVP